MTNLNSIYKIINLIISIIFVLSILASCTNERTEKKLSDVSKVSDVIVYSAPFPETRSNIGIKDMTYITSYLGEGIVRTVNKTIKYQMYNYDEGRLYVFYDYDSFDYQAVIIAVASEKSPSEIVFDDLKVGVSTINDVEKMDPSTRKSFVSYSRENEYFSIHLTNEGIVFIYYTKENNQYIVSKVKTQYTSLSNSILQNDLIGE